MSGPAPGGFLGVRPEKSDDQDQTLGADLLGFEPQTTEGQPGADGLGMRLVGSAKLEVGGFLGMNAGGYL